MENLTIDLIPLAKSLLGGFPVGIIMMFFIRRYWKKIDLKEIAQSNRLSDMEKTLMEIKLQLAGLGIDNLRDVLEEMKKKDYELEFKVNALFRNLDEGNMLPKRASDKGEK